MNFLSQLIVYQGSFGNYHFSTVESFAQPARILIFNIIYNLMSSFF